MEKSFDALSERISVAETLLKYLQESRSGIELLNRKMDVVRQPAVGIEHSRKSVEKRSNREGENRKVASEEEESRLKRGKFVNDVKMKQEVLDEHLVMVTEHVERLEVSQAEFQSIWRRARERLKEIEAQEEMQRAAREKLVERERKLDIILETLDERMVAVEKREREFNCFLEGKMRETALKEERLELKLYEFAKHVELVYEKIRKQEKLRNGFIERVELAERKLEDMRATIDGRFEEIKFRENVAWEDAAASVKEADSIREAMEKQSEELEKMRSEIDSFQEHKLRELASKEQLLNVMSKKILKDAELRNGFMERVELAERKLEDMRATIDGRFKEIEFRENVRWEDVAASVEEADSIRGAMEKELEELEKMRSEIDSFQEHKMRELASKEQLLNVMSKEILKDAELRNEQLIEREKLAHQLLKRLEVSQDNVEGLKKVVDERFKEIGLKEIEINSIRDWVERMMDKVDTKAKELEEKEKRMKIKEDDVICKEHILGRKKKKLHLKGKTLRALQNELEVKRKEVDLGQQLNEQRSEKLDVREKAVNSVREMTRKCFQQHVVIKRKLLLEKDLVDKSARFLGLQEECLEHALRELEFRGQRMREHKQQEYTDDLNSLVETEPDESADVKFIVRMDGKTLQMFLNDPEKDLESMGDEIFKVLHLSSDPAKLVLDAMAGFYPPHLRKGDMSIRVRRTCIALLEQLIKMCRKIKPCVREEAIELAIEWKSKMRATAGQPNSLEVLGLLFLLAAYDLASHFDKDEISHLLMIVDQHIETFELYRGLGFTESSAE